MSRTRRVAAASAALTLCAALTGCQFLVSQLPDGPSPAPTAPPTTGETQIQRQMRLDYAAAEKAYRVASAEGGRLIASGVTKPTPALKRVTTGEYADLAVTLAKQVRDGELTVKGVTVIRGVVDSGWQEKKVELTACEDVSKVRIFQGGKRVKGNSSPYYVQHLTVVKTDARTWKVSSQKTTQLATLAGQPCVDS